MSPPPTNKKEAPTEPFDVMVVPGCPTRQDGSPSNCLLARSAWGAVLYHRGWTRHLITSGGAVHSPFVEADGGIRRETVPLMAAAGADFIVPGSLMFKETPSEMRKWLAALPTGN